MSNDIQKQNKELIAAAEMATQGEKMPHRILFSFPKGGILHDNLTATVSWDWLKEQHDKYRALEAEVERLRAATEWQDISTAPKSAPVPPVDLWFPTEDGGYRMSDCYWFVDGYWSQIGNGGKPLGQMGGEPTHWMMPPAPPSAVSEHTTTKTKWGME
jgi:hypothetical protein